FTINLAELSSADALLAHNGSLNVIYESDECMPDGHMFVAVIDAIQGDGFNPLWQEVQIAFTNPGFPCQQLTGDEDIVDAAVTGVTGTVTTAYLYWGGLNPGDGFASYDNGTIAINGNTITGTSLGDTSTNCWGQGASRVYLADVTPYVTGDGTYTLTDLMQQP